MWELKELFDPDYVLNPGVILNKDPLVSSLVCTPWPCCGLLDLGSDAELGCPDDAASS